MAVQYRILDQAFAVRDISAPAKLLLLNMAKLGNRSGEVFICQEKLAAMSSCSVRTTRRSLGELRNRKFITRVPNPGRATVRYILNHSRWIAGQKVRPEGT